MKTTEAQQRAYNTSAKGRARTKRYRASEKARAVRARYEASAKGKATIERYRNTLKGMFARTRSALNKNARRHAGAVEALADVAREIGL
jgi:DnaJ-domain-containing protein 1